MARTIFFTGFPGFLGLRVLPRVLRRDPEARAVCLVQDRFHSLADDRAQELVDADPALKGRIRLVVGDITEPDLGLREQRDELAAEIVEVWHLAAAYDLEVSRALGMRVNVAGTRNVLDLCRAADGLQRLHYVSTCYVSGRYPGVFRETDLVKGQRFNNYYEETKHLAEVLVAEAMSDGMPATVYRPSVVGGDATTGETQKYDGPYFLLRWLHRQPRIAVLPMIGDPDGYRFNVVPRDFVIDGIEALSARDDTVGGTYALADPEPYTIRELVDRLSAVTGRRILTVPLPRRLAKAALRFIPGLQALMGIPPAAVDYFSHPTHYTTDHAAPLLAEESVTLPDRDVWLQAMSDFVRDNPEVTSAAMV